MAVFGLDQIRLDSQKKEKDYVSCDGISLDNHRMDGRNGDSRKGQIHSINHVSRRGTCPNDSDWRIEFLCRLPMTMVDAHGGSIFAQG